MQTHDKHRREEAASTAKAPAPEASEQSPLQLAGTIGNSAMQRVAGSPSLQRSAAAAPLLSGQPSTLARQAQEEELEVPDPSEPAEKEADAAAEHVAESDAGQAAPEEEDLKP